ncbi:unnamed protein product [Adineta steineri]|uniref:Exostosin GT47 domain-containing protein n=1 Tax=Adineta steineri TaxID=433720 RepID=A0A815FJZ1_9BILA|nr:unnamed protein product [Adineta steineri]CAF3690557.1 unnamed protein product [Adineta steineri]
MQFVYSHRRLKYIFMLSVSILMIITIVRYFVNHIFSIEISSLYLPLCPYSFKINGNYIVYDDSSYYIHHYPEFICPQNFRNLADWIYGWPESVFNEKIEYSVSVKKLNVPNLPNGSIIYVKVDSISSFFSNIYPYLMYKFVLITGQGDDPMPSRFHRYLEESDSKIIHWFGQNGDINATSNEHFTHIPIGINCFEMAEGIRGVHRQYSKHILPSISNNNLDEPSHYIQPHDITQNVLTNKNQSDKIVLINFRPDTDPTGLRTKLHEGICKNNQSSFTICYDKPDGVDISRLPTIYKRNRQYPLWLSPRGGGLDCHRTWEALYLDIIPIVWHSTLDSLYTNLPIIIINDWSEVNEEFLRKKLHEIAMKKAQQPSVYQYEKLRNTYWREIIIKKSRYAFNEKDIQRNRCWRAKTIR